MTYRPEYVKCVAHPHVSKHRTRKREDGTLEVVKRVTTLCGRTNIMGFMFVGLDHAFCHANEAGRLLICPECSEKARKVLLGGTEQRAI